MSTPVGARKKKGSTTSALDAAAAAPAQTLGRGGGSALGALSLGRGGGAVLVARSLGRGGRGGGSAAATTCPTSIGVDEGTTMAPVSIDDGSNGGGFPFQSATQGSYGCPVRIQRRWLPISALLAVAVSYRSFPGIPSSSPGSCGCPAVRKYTGIVEDCCCDYETVDTINEEVLHPILQELVKLPFFRYFKVKLWCDCPFWPDDGMCKLRDCSVCECPENEFPEPFRKPYSGLSPDSMMCQEGKPQAAVDKTLDSKVFKGWVETDNPWTSDDETDNNEMTYVNLQLNPERYTGYTGDSARRIWDAIYKENCPKYPSEELCHEKKALYKLISGLHSSISVHIAYDYLLDESTNSWGQNLPLLYDRVLKYPERVQNLYFTYLFVLRAVTKAADYLEQAEYNTGNPEDDLKTESLVKQLLYNSKLRSACPLPFDEAKLWQGENGPELKQEIQKQFRNISAIMDCVGCEKCRLWGKLQVLGLGTALKILFSVDGDSHLSQPLQLQRNEVIALFNLLNRLSESVKFVHEKGSSIEEVIKEQSPSTFQKGASKPNLKLDFL